MVPGSRSTNTARGTYLPPYVVKKKKKKKKKKKSTALQKKLLLNRFTVACVK
jgi:hypothetical protein